MCLFGQGVCVYVCVCVCLYVYVRVCVAFKRASLVCIVLTVQVFNLVGKAFMPSLYGTTPHDVHGTNTVQDSAMCVCMTHYKSETGLSSHSPCKTDLSLLNSDSLTISS